MSATIEFRRETTIEKTNSISSNLLAYWSMEEASGTIYDQLGNVDMTPYDGPVYQQTGKINYGIAFGTSNLTGCRNSVNDEATNPNGDEYTIQAWVYLHTLPSSGSTHYVITRGSLPATPWENIVTRVRYSDNRPEMRFTGVSDNNYSYHTSALSIETWYHLVFVIRGAGFTPLIYINNSSVAGSTTQVGDIYDVSGTNAGFNIGNSYDGDTGSFDGVIDEVAIWNRALTSDEITWLYNSGDGRSYSEF